MNPASHRWPTLLAFVLPCWFTAPAHAGDDSLGLTARLAKSLGYAADVLPADVATQVRAAARPEALVPLVSTLVAGTIAQEVPIAGEVFDVGLAALALNAMGWEFVHVVPDVFAFVKGAMFGRTDVDYRRAGAAFARVVSRVGVDVALAILVHKAGKRLRSEVRAAAGPGGGGTAPAPAFAGAGGGGAGVVRYRVLADGRLIATGAAGAGVLGRPQPLQMSGGDPRENQAGATGGPTQPSRPPSPSARPDGKPRVLDPKDRDAHNQRGWEGEHEIAEVLARNGYQVEQQPLPKPNGKKPDFKIEGRYFDGYTPDANTNARSIWDRVLDKAKREQADRIIINLNACRVDVTMLRRQFLDWTHYVPQLTEVLGVRGEQIIRIWP